MQLALRKLSYYRIIIGREVEPHQPVEKNKFLNLLTETFDYLCTHISRDIIFHLEGFRKTREALEKLENLFVKHDELRGHLLENELVALHPSSFETIEQLFTKFNSLALQCKQCETERKDEKNFFSILEKIGSKYSIFVSIFHSKQEGFPGWKIPSLDSFSESLIKEQQKLIQMGVIKSSKD